MQKKIRILSLLLALALSAGLFAGCRSVPLGEEETAAQAEADIFELETATDLVPLEDAPPIDVFLSPVASGEIVKENGKALFDVSNSKDGYVMIKYLEKNTGAKLKVQIKGPSGVTYTYNLRNDGEYDVFPLSDGNGDYKLGAYKNTSGTKYAVLQTYTYTVALADEFAPFIRPNQYVNYKADSKIVSFAEELLKDETDTIGKVEAIYTYVVKNFTYDKELARTVKSGYLPDVDKVLAAKKGICFDYAAVMAAMLRSQGIPCKLVVGYAGDAYHAWINVYSEESGWINGAIFFDGADWKLMDPTFASGGASEEYIGNGVNYTAKYLY